MTLKSRVIPCLDVKDGRVVKGVNFVDLIDAGDPVEAAIAYDAAGADELCYEALKAEGARGDCEDEGNCSRPELTADMGRLISGQAGTPPVTVKNLGEVALTFFNPTVAPGSSDPFRPLVFKRILSNKGVFWVKSA